MRYLLLLFIVYTSSFGDALTNRMDRLVQNTEVQKVILLKYNPFTHEDDSQNPPTDEASVEKKSVTKHFNLVSIFNKRAFINGKWFGEGDLIYGYEIKKVDSESVLLKKNNKEISLKFQRKNILEFSYSKNLNVLPLLTRV